MFGIQVGFSRIDPGEQIKVKGQCLIVQKIVVYPGYIGKLKGQIVRMLALEELLLKGRDRNGTDSTRG